MYHALSLPASTPCLQPCPIILGEDGETPLVADWAHALDFVLATALLLDAATMEPNEAHGRRHLLQSCAQQMLRFTWKVC